MKTVNILHLTDLHFSQEYRGTPVVDVRDKSLTGSSMAATYEGDCRIRFHAEVLRLLGGQTVDMIAFTGDLGFKFDTTNLALGADYIESLAKRLNVSSCNVVVTPGNHDVQRDAPSGQELAEFSRVCDERGFSHAGAECPASLEVKGLPVLALNSCMGASVHALHGIPESFWIKVQKDLAKYEQALSSEDTIGKIKDDLKYQVQCMDIPALGFAQIDAILAQLDDSESQSALVLMHHNPVPTDNVQIRPYANLLDSGPLLYKIFNSNKHVILLHGHTHCKAELSAHNHGRGGRGVISAIGNSGLSSDSRSEASFVQIILTDQGCLAKANVFSLRRNAASYEKEFAYSVSRRSPSELPLLNEVVERLPREEMFTFTQAAELLDKPADERLAQSIVQLESAVLDITNMSEDYMKWRIKRRI